MLFNISRYNRETDRQIKLLVGPSFPWRERLQLRGIGSPRLQISAASPAIMKLCEKHNNTGYANIELRARGILVGFKAILETWIWVIPYDHLWIDSEHSPIIITDNKENMHLTYPRQETGLGAFMEKLTRVKNTYALSQQS